MPIPKIPLFFIIRATNKETKRPWCAFGLMSTHSRLHGSTSYRVSWTFDEEACDVLRFYTKLKGRMMPSYAG
jgi:alpha-glucosidase (family GH31 glycosyl hydrolase)